MKLTFRPFVLILAAVLMGAPASALTLKVASVAPEGTPWGAALNEMAEDWSKISGGEVVLKIFQNGIQKAFLIAETPESDLDLRLGGQAARR